VSRLPQEKIGRRCVGDRALELGAIELQQGAKRGYHECWKSARVSSSGKKRLQYLLLLLSERSGKPDSQLVGTWEAYINDDEGDVFQPLQMLQSLQLCLAVLVKVGASCRSILSWNERWCMQRIAFMLVCAVGCEEVIPPVPLSPFPTVRLWRLQLIARIVSRAPNWNGRPESFATLRGQQIMPR
jgi:hypothetical protein